MLDSGSPLSALPAAIYAKLVAAFPYIRRIHNEFGDMYEVECPGRDDGGSIDFDFGGTIINVPYYYFVWQYRGNPGVCLLGAYESGRLVP